MAKKKPARAPKPAAGTDEKQTVPDAEGVLKMAVNGHILTGEKFAGKWRFECSDWPEIAADRGDSLEGAIGAFMAKALAGAVAFRESAAGTSLFDALDKPKNE